jgi:hypothetical protein
LHDALLIVPENITVLPDCAFKFGLFQFWRFDVMSAAGGSAGLKKALETG